MFGRFMPREDRFFTLFTAHADQVVLAARQLSALMEATDPEEARSLIASIDEIKKLSAKTERDTTSLLHTSFITPFDRDAILALVGHMDDIVDAVQEVSEGISLYNIRRLTPDCSQLAKLTHSCAQRVHEAVCLLDNMSLSADILRSCRQIEQLEDECDRVMRNALARTFRDERDALLVIKLKAIYEALERITDRCENVAKVLERLVLESA